MKNDDFLLKTVDFYNETHRTDVPIRRTRFFVDFDPTEGEASDRVLKTDSVQVLEVRQGNVLSYLNAGDYTGEGCFLEDDNGIYRFESTTTAMVDTDLCYLIKSDLAEVKEEFPEVETSIQTVMNEKNMAERPRRMFGEASGGDGDLSAAEMKELLITQLHFSEGDELEQLIEDMDQDGGGTVDEFEFAAWFRARHASEQAHFREILSGETLGELVEWVVTAHLENGQIEECLDSPKPQPALVDKILSTPRLLDLIHEDQGVEREYYSRYLDHEVEKDSEYLVSRLDPVNGAWIARNPGLGRQLLQELHAAAQFAESELTARQLHVRGIGIDGWDGTTAENGDYENVASMAKIFSPFGVFDHAQIHHRVVDSANTSWALVTLGDTASVDSVLAAHERRPLFAGNHRLVLHRFSPTQAKSGQGGMLTVQKRQVIGRVLAQLSLIEEVRQDEDKALEATGREPVDRLLYSTRAELSAIVLRGELAELSLGALHARAREEEIELPAMKEALESEQPMASLIDVMVPMEIRSLPDEDDAEDEEQGAADRLGAVRQEIASGEMEMEGVVALLNDLGQLQQELQQQLVAAAGGTQ